MANKIVIDPPEHKPGVYLSVNNKLVAFPPQFFSMERDESKYKNDFMSASFDVEKLHTEED